MSALFTHLHVHSEYSMLDSLSRIGDMFDTAKEQSAPALAITDHGTLAAMWQARVHSQRTGVKVIPGLEGYLSIGSRFERIKIDVPADDAASEGDEGAVKSGARVKQRAYEHITILARNRAGWLNLIKLQNESSKHTYGRAKLIDYELLKEHGDGLMILTGCIGGPVFGPLSRAEAAWHEGENAEDEVARGNAFLRAEHEEGRARSNLEKLIAAVGSENVYVEVMEHGNPAEQATLEHLRKLAAEFDLQIVATNDSHHTRAEDRVAHGAWLAVQSKSTLANPKFSFHGTGYHLRDGDEMRSLVDTDWWREACENTNLVAARVEANIVPDPSRLLPEFPAPEGFDHPNDYLRKLVADGIQQKLGGDLTEEYRQRLNFELNTIVSMGFVSYFLIVWEMINWARSESILVGPGRGSAAGSLVAYLMNITDVDPIEYHLLFERFLEPGRAELPDIDIDFESRYKQRVIRHLMDVWGEDCVAQIGNVGKPKIRGSWKNALRALGEKPTVIDRTGKLIPADMKIDELLRDRTDTRTREFWAAAGKLPYLEQALVLMEAFYEVAATGGVHASGVIISPVPLTNLIPMRWAKPAEADFYRWVTEWDYRDLEQFGLVKFDVLAIRNLDMAHVTMDLVANRGEQLTLPAIPHPDHDASDVRVKKAFDMLKAGRTAGVFQLESTPMTQLLEDVAPDNLGELSAVVALFRPGPLSAGMHTKFADRKHGRERVSYDYLTSDPVETEWLNTVMGVTYAVFVYQEQIMALGRVVAGFDDVWRSKLRKAVSKKNEVLMAEVGEKFLTGAEQEHRDETGELISPVFSRATAVRVWEAMKGSAEYLFNASHSYAYALIAYYTAYLKANYPGEYGAATLSVTGPDKKEKRVAAMNALIGEGMRILPPDANISAEHTLPEGLTDVRLGLGEIKGFGKAALDLIAERESAGEFTSLDNLLTRVKVGDENRQLASNQVDALIDSGALDRFGPRMGMHVIAKAGDLSNLPVPQIEFSPVELGVRQSERLLMMLDAGVRDEIQSTLTGWTRPSHDSFFEQPRAITVGELEQSNLDDGSQVYVSGILSTYSEKAYSKGIMGRMEIQDTAGSLQGVIWEEQRAKAKSAGDIPPSGFPVVLCGRLETRTFTIQAAPEEVDVAVDLDDDSEQTENETEITRRQIMVQSVYPIGVDLSPRGFMPASTFPVLNLTGEPVVAKESAEELESIKRYAPVVTEGFVNTVEIAVEAPVLVMASTGSQTASPIARVNAATAPQSAPIQAFHVTEVATTDSAPEVEPVIITAPPLPAGTFAWPKLG